MSIEIWIELIGYIGSVSVAISLMMKNILKLRVINMIGAFFFMVYSLIITTYPIFFVNLIIFLVDLYYLYVLLTKEELFSLINIEDKQSPFLKSFIKYYYDDICKFFPNFDYDTIKDSQILVIFRDMVPVGLFASKPINDKEIRILVDYIIPEYRDFKNAEYLYKVEIQKYKEKGYQAFITHTQNGGHKRYLKKIGYKQDTKDKTMYKRKF